MGLGQSKTSILLSSFFAIIFVFATPFYAFAVNHAPYMDPGDITLPESQSSVESPDTENSVKPATGMVETVITASYLTYKAKCGDNLTRIANRFGVKVDDLVSEFVNPKLAARKKPDLIYCGEVITIPVYRVEISGMIMPLLQEKMVMLTPENFGAKKVNYESAIAVSEGKDKKIAELESKLKSNFNLTGLSLIIALLVAVAFIAAYIYKYGQRVRYEEEFIIQSEKVQRLEEELRTEKALKKAVSPSFENSTPEEILEALRTARGMTLGAANKLIFTKDEVGNDVYLKNIEKFLENPNRDYLRNLPVNQWEEAMNIAKMNPKPAEDEPRPGGTTFRSDKVM